MKDGILIVCNYIREWWGKSTGVFYPKFAVSISEEKYLMAVIPVLILLGLLGIYLYVELVKSKSLPVHIALLAAGVFLLYHMPVCPMPAAIVLIWLFLCSLSGACRKRLQETKQSVVIHVVLLGIVCIFSGLCIEKSGLSAELYQSGSTISEKLRYGVGKESLLPEGNLSNLGEKILPDETALEVVMSKPESYYLRGFVGTNYTGNGFEASSNEDTYSFEALKYDFPRESFRPENQLFLVNQMIHTKQEENQMKLQTKMASAKYLYAPYELSSDVTENGRVKEDKNMTYMSEKILGEKSYGYSAIKNLTGDYLQLSKEYETYSKEYGAYFQAKESTVDAERIVDRVHQYELAESYYNVYVYEKELEIPGEIKALLSEELGTYDLGEGTHFPYYKAKKNILEYLNQNIEYDTSVGNRAPEKDFLYGFLQTTKSGYDVQFAAAATLMYRYYGIPARYVEGYLITPKDIQSAESYKPIEISCKNAHAWVEIYQDGIGWIPIEVTPPYLTVMEQPSDITVAVGSSTGESENDSNIKKVKPEDEKEQHFVKAPDYIPVFIIVGIVTVVSFLAIGMVVFLLHWKTKKAKRQSLLAGFCLSNRSSAVYNLFREYREMFDDIPTVVEKAVFSRTAVTEEEYQEFYQRCISMMKAAK